MRYLTRLAALMIFAAGTLFVADAPASAHTPNPYANWACGGSRPSGSYDVDHAVPEAMGPGWVLAFCEGTLPLNAQRTQWDARLNSDGSITKVAGYYYCTLGDACIPEPG